MLYIICASVLLLVIAYFSLTIDKRIVEKYYRIKLPFICWVSIVKTPDKIIWGNKRYRRITSKGKKDYRYALNVKINYPTKIVIRHFQILIWNKSKANAVYNILSEYMTLPLSYYPFFGHITGDILQFFDNSSRKFVIYCGKLMEFVGWQCVLTGKEHPQLVGKAGDKLLYVQTILQPGPVVLNDMIKFHKAQSNGQLLYITASKFSSGARLYAIEHGIYLMDPECLRRTLVYEEMKYMR